MLSNAFLHTGGRLLLWFRVGKQRVMYIGRCMPASSTNDYLIVALIPFENGTGADAKFLAHFGGDGYLPLGSDFGLSDNHNVTLPG